MSAMYCNPYYPVSHNAIFYLKVGQRVNLTTTSMVEVQVRWKKTIITITQVFFMLVKAKHKISFVTYRTTLKDQSLYVCLFLYNSFRAIFADVTVYVLAPKHTNIRDISL